MTWCEELRRRAGSRVDGGSHSFSGLDKAIFLCSQSPPQDNKRIQPDLSTSSQSTPTMLNGLGAVAHSHLPSASVGEGVHGGERMGGGRPHQQRRRTLLTPLGVHTHSAALARTVRQALLAHGLALVLTRPAAVAVAVASGTVALLVLHYLLVLEHLG